MRRLSIAALAFIGLQGCIYYVYPPPKVHERPYDLDDPQVEASEVLQMGTWTFELSNPVLDESEQCQTVDLGQVDYFAAQVNLIDLGLGEIVAESPFGDLYGYVDTEFFFVNGGLNFEGQNGTLELQADITSPETLAGVGVGQVEGCAIFVDFDGIAIQPNDGNTEGSEGELN